MSGLENCLAFIARCFLPPSTSTPQQESQPPNEFFCPISGFLMSDPVIVIPTGHSFDRPCIQACIDLNYIPPVLSSNQSLNMSSLSLVPNLSLKEAIFNWCNRVSHQPPFPISHQEARYFIQILTRRSEAPNQEPPSNARGREPTSDTYLEEEIWKKFTTPNNSASALDFLSRLASTTTRRTVSLCTQRILAAVVPMLWSDYTMEAGSIGSLSRPRGISWVVSDLQTNAVDAIMLFSQEPPNIIKILACGALPALLHVVANGKTTQTRTNAVLIIHRLAKEENNRMMMGGMGVIPPLLEIFYNPSFNIDMRKEAAWALYHLTSCGGNRKIVAEMRTIPQLLEIVTDKSSGDAIELRERGMGLLCNLAETVQCIEDLVRLDAVELMVKMVREGDEVERDCLGVLYGISINTPSWEFKRMAVAAGAVEVLAEQRPRWQDAGLKMASAMLRMIEGGRKMSSPSNVKFKPKLGEITEVDEMH